MVQDLTAEQHRVRSTPRELAAFKIGAIWAGVAKNASYKSDWLRAVSIFRQSASDTNFIAGVTAQPDKLNDFIDLLIKRHGFAVTKDTLPRFLSATETFKRLYMHDRESLALPWIQSLPDPKLQASILQAQPWVYNILRKDGSRGTAKQVFGLLSGLEPKSLTTLLTNNDPCNLSIIREKMTKKDARALAKIAGLKI